MAFKKGDRVRYIGDHTPSLKGEVGTVTKDAPGGTVDVEWDSGITHTTSVFNDSVELLTSTPVEIEIGKEYRLLPNGRRAGAPTIFNRDVTRVKVLSGPDAEGDYFVESLNGTDDLPRYVGAGSSSYILPHYLAPLEEAPEMEIEVGKEYRLLPNALKHPKRPVSFNNDVTRVRVSAGVDSDGDVRATALNGAGSRFAGGVGHESWVLPEFLAPLEEERKVEMSIPPFEDGESAPTVNYADYLQLQERVTELLAEVEQHKQQFRDAVSAHQHDIDLIGTALIEAADGDRYRSGSPWCSEYDDAIDDVNVNLNVKLPLREREWNVDIHFDRYTAVITATSQEEADDVARRQYDNGDITPDISYTDVEAV